MSRCLSICLFALILLPRLSAAPIPAFTSEGFRIPQPGAQLSYPRDHASHPDYKIEWWYLTGHLSARTGERFGYQATFFRRALKTPGNPTHEAFGSSQLFLTHMAVTDEEEGTFHCEQRLSRGGWDAGAETQHLDVWNGNWQLQSVGEHPLKMQLEASVNADVQLLLELNPSKPLVQFGEDGTSRKGPLPEARSYYLTYSRIATMGTLVVGEREFTLSGTSWMDHEIASSQLDPSYTGWDWIAIQLEDGWEVKAYLLRQPDGSPSPYSALIWISPEGTLSYATVEDFSWEKPSRWKSPTTKATYPNRPVIKAEHPLSGESVEFKFIPLIDEQELVFPGSTYWEGAGRILNEDNREVGSAYLELVGYAGPIEGLR